MRTRVKFCGLTAVDDALAAAALGVDAIGLVFVPGSPRCVSTDQAAAIARALPPFVARVALVMDAEPEAVRAILSDVPVDWLQFHGREDDDFCAAFARPWLKAVPMAEVDDLTGFMARHPRAGGFVLDSHVAGGAGGTGSVFDWRRAEGAHARPVLLAGGLRPENVREAITRTRPWGVDVSSGIESSPGRKDRDRMKSFLDEVRRAGGWSD